MSEEYNQKQAEWYAKTLIDYILQSDTSKISELKETPRRIADLYKDMTEGLHINIEDYFSRILPTDHSEMVIIKDIEFVSMCEHHWWPFIGKVHVAYIPDKHIVGLSKFHSAVRALARRPQLQERLTSQLANVIEKKLKPKGVLVIVEGQHTCMLVGGRFDYGMPAHTNSITITSAVRGIFLKPEEGKDPKNEALKLIYGGK